MGFSGSIEDLRAFAEAIPSPVFVKSRSHRFVLANTAACAFLGRSRDELLSLDDHALFPADQVRGFREADDVVFAQGNIAEREERVTDATGAVHHVITRKQLAIIDGTQYLVALVSDVTAWREAEARTRYLTSYDPLTGLPNSALIDEHIERALLNARDRCALLVSSFDHFGLVAEGNDVAAANNLIVQFAQRLLDVARAGDTVARLGGDAFAILVADIGGGSIAEEICQRVLTAASRTFELPGSGIQLGASIGLAFSSPETTTPQEIRRRAGVALQQAKAEGGARWCAYSDAFDRKFKDRHATEADLRAALSTGTGFEIYYQPLVTVASRDVVGFEALARWHHPTRGMVMPDAFIPVAEASGLIVALGELVLARACRDAAAWNRPLRLSVNVSPAQFVRGDLVRTIRRALEDSGLDPRRLELEITECVLIDNASGALALLSQIQALGVKIVLDDFGSGFSSLGYLRYFPFDKVKIDKTFITDMLGSEKAISIVATIISLCKSLKMQVVAEGVEDSGQLDLLRALGCDQAQGYLISRPMPIATFTESVSGSVPPRRRPRFRKFRKYSNGLQFIR